MQKLANMQEINFSRNGLDEAMTGWQNYHQEISDSNLAKANASSSSTTPGSICAKVVMRH
jgi:hypothetical protein